MPIDSEPVAAPGERDTRLAQLILTVFALYARLEDNWLSIASVVKLMSELGSDGQAVRSSISRLKRRGTLVSEKRNGVAGYLLPAQTLNMLADGDVRIFNRTRAKGDDSWLLVVFSVPESERVKRHSLRSTLTHLGFGIVSPGVWIAPAALAEETARALERQRLADYVDFFVGSYLSEHELSASVRRWWNLDDLERLYRDFIERFGPVELRAAADDLSPLEAFRAYVPLLTEWRRLPYRDPGLPLSALPPEWTGEAAWSLFDRLNHALRPLAQEFAMGVLSAPRSKRPPSSP